MITLITGGVKSGKSRRALELAQNWWLCPGGAAPQVQVSFIATAEALDEEMGLRIKRHQEERAGLGGTSREKGFVTIEEPLDLAKAILEAGLYAVVDCLPMWINNLMYYQREADFPRLLEGFIRGMRNCIVVTNETGLGNIPFDEATRRYNQLLAEANRTIAARADRVELLVCGIPLTVKG
jgi:adenosylcobinamide kinase/adenosylcobinamide-phosphate guanylyltransferase